MADTNDTMNRGQALLRKGDIAGALELFKAVISHCEEIGSYAGQVEPLQLMSKIYEVSNETEKGIETNERLLAIYKTVEDQVGQGRVLNNLGLHKARVERYVDAIDSFQSARDLFEALGDSLGVADQFANIGSVYRDMKKNEAALRHYEQARSLFESLDRKERVADQHTNIAYIHVMDNRLGQALSCYRQALPLYEQAGAGQKADATRQNLDSLEKSAG